VYGSVNKYEDHCHTNAPYTVSIGIVLAAVDAERQHMVKSACQKHYLAWHTVVVWQQHAQLLQPAQQQCDELRYMAARKPALHDASFMA
jgi:hypothetical protein